MRKNWAGFTAPVRGLLSAKKALKVLREVAMHFRTYAIASAALAFVNPLLIFPAAIAQKILKDPLGHIFAFNYSVTGTWADPKVAKRAVEAAVPA